MQLSHYHRLILTVVVLTACLTGRLTGTNAAPPAVKQTTTSFTVNWTSAPTVTSAHGVPGAARSLLLQVLSSDGVTVLRSVLLVRPVGGGSTTVSFDPLPIGPVVIAASAFPNADGTGIVLADTATRMTLSQRSMPLAIALSSTIKSVDIAGESPGMNVGDSMPLTATPTDHAHHPIAVDNDGILWASSDPHVARVSAKGVVMAMAPGVAQITARAVGSSAQDYIRIIVTKPPAPGTLVAYDTFNYPVGQKLAGLNGGFGWSVPWHEHGYGGNTPSVIVAECPAFKNLAISGNGFETTSSAPNGDDREWNSTIGKPGQVVYASMLMHPLDDVNAGRPFTYFQWSVGDVAIGKSSRDSHIGLEHAGNGGGGEVSTSVVAEKDVTYFLVVRVTFGESQSKVDLWVNPTPGRPLPAVPDATRMGNFTTMDRLGSGTSIRCIYGGYRVGYTFADVAPTK